MTQKDINELLERPTTKVSALIVGTCEGCIGEDKYRWQKCRDCVREHRTEDNYEAKGGAGSTSPALDGSAMIPEELINGYINHLSWSDQATDREKTLVAGNIRGFAVWLRTHMYGLYTPIHAKPNAGSERPCGRKENA